ncbi:MAG: hypothetical protein B7X11_06090, partial [Acidobacteria bacterium 37-65-4]
MLLRLPGIRSPRFKERRSGCIPSLPRMISDEQAKRIFLEMGFHLLPREWAQVRLYMDLLLKWNRRVNLTRIIEEEAICQEHFGESFYISQRLPLGCQAVLDVGSGAGFPGLAVKIRRPQLRLTLVE